MTTIVLGLNSGREVTVSKVMLYPAKLVEEAVNLKAQAMGKMGHVSTGIGFLGSPGWAIAGALLVGAVENSINNKNHNEGVSLFQRAAQKFEEAKSGARLIDVREISNTHQPIPQIWKAVSHYIKDVSFSGLNHVQIDNLCKKHDLDKARIYKIGLFTDFKLLQEVETVQWSEEYVFGGEDFVAVETTDGLTYIKWADVSTYKLLAEDGAP